MEAAYRYGVSGHFWSGQASDNLELFIFFFGNPISCSERAGQLAPARKQVVFWFLPARQKPSLKMFLWYIMFAEEERTNHSSVYI